MLPRAPRACRAARQAAQAAVQQQQQRLRHPGAAHPDQRTLRRPPHTGARTCVCVCVCVFLHCVFLSV
jgi:hypothetical protein